MVTSELSGSVVLKLNAQSGWFVIWEMIKNKMFPWVEIYTSAGGIFPQSEMPPPPSCYGREKAVKSDYIDFMSLCLQKHESGSNPISVLVWKCRHYLKIKGVQISQNLGGIAGYVTRYCQIMFQHVLEQIQQMWSWFEWLGSIYFL